MAKKGFNNDRQERLLVKLTNDTCSKLSESERNLGNVSIDALIWNLFNGGYKFASSDISFIIQSKQNYDETHNARY